MVSVTVTTPSLVPDYDDIGDLLSPYYGLDVTFPGQLSLPPPPVWPTINSPFQDVESNITEMIDSQMVGMETELLSVLTDFLGISLDSVLPDIPGFPGFNLENILNGELQDLIDLASMPSFDFSAISLLPDPVYPTLNVPDWKALVATQTAINEYYQNLVLVIQDLIADVTDELEVPGMPTLPTFPTLTEIYAQLPPNPTISDLFLVSIPGFSFTLSMPQPLIPTLNTPNYDFIQGLRNLYSGLSNENISTIVDFVDGLPLTFTYPVFSLTFEVNV